MSVLHRQHQLEFDSWVCKVCGYVNASISKVCRGAIDVPLRRWKREVEGVLLERQQLELWQLADESIYTSKAHCYARGSNPDSDRWESVRMGSEAYMPAGLWDGHWVVPCSMKRNEAFGGHLMDTDGVGLTRAGTLLASILAHDTENAGVLRRLLEEDVMRAIRDEMNSVHGVAADRMQAYHDRWIQLHLSLIHI